MISCGSVGGSAGALPVNAVRTLVGHGSTSSDWSAMQTEHPSYPEPPPGSAQSGETSPASPDWASTQPEQLGDTLVRTQVELDRLVGVLRRLTEAVEEDRNFGANPLALDDVLAESRRVLGGRGTPNG